MITPKRNLRNSAGLGALAVAAILALCAGAVEAQERESPPVRSTPRASRPSVRPSSPPPSTPRPSTPAPQTPSARPAPNRGSGSTGHGRGHHGYGYGYGYRHHGYYGYYGYGLYWPYHRFYRPYYYGHYPYYPWGFSWYPTYRGDTRIGAIDLKIKPKADVYVDGEYIGRSGKYDGYPGYLWLSEGTHQLVFYNEGKKTTERIVRVGYGPVRRLKMTLPDGPSIAPEELFEPVREARIAPEGVEEPRIRQPVERQPVDRERRDEPARTESHDEIKTFSVDLREDPGRFRLEIEPPDAAVYLDGRFLGKGDRLSRLHSGMLVEPGEHYIEVQRPGFETERIDFTVAAGDETTLSVNLADTSGAVE